MFDAGGVEVRPLSLPLCLSLSISLSHTLSLKAVWIQHILRHAGRVKGDVA